MVIINGNVNLIIDNLIEKYVDYKQTQEYGTSIFWNWIYRVRNYMWSMDCISLPIGINLKQPFETTGEFIYSKFVKNKQITVIVHNFNYSQTQLNLLLHGKSTQNPYIVHYTWGITKYPSGLPNIAIVCSNANLYTWFNTITNKLVNPKKWYCEIGEFNSLGNTYVCVRSKSGNEYYRFIDKTLHYLNKNKYLQIGVSPKGNYYVQYPNKRFQILKPDLTPLDGFYYENVIVNNGCMYGEINGEDYLVETKLYKEKPNHQKITLTENQFYNFILNCVNKVLKTT